MTASRSLFWNRDVDGVAVAATTSTSALNGGSKDEDYAAADNTTILQYASGEFFEGNDLVDEIVIDDDDAIIAELSDELKITTSTDFSNFSMSNGDRTVATEGLIIKTAASVTGASSVVLDADAGKYLQGIDLTAGTTGDSTIDASKDSLGIGFLLAGSLGRNTIKGGEGSDAIIGANENDSLVGDKGDDRITTGKGDDTVDGGSGDDLIVMGDNFDPAFDVIKGGTGADTLSFTFQEGNNESILDGLTDIEGIEGVELGAANTSITLNEVLAGDDAADTVAKGTTFKVAFAKASTTETLTFDGSEETNGKVSVTGASGADIITGSAGDDTITGGAGADNLTGGAGADVFSYATDAADVLVAGNDTIADFVTGTDGITVSGLGNTTGYATAGAAGAAGIITIGASASTLCCSLRWPPQPVMQLQLLPSWVGFCRSMPMVSMVRKLPSRSQPSQLVLASVLSQLATSLSPDSLTRRASIPS